MIYFIGILDSIKTFCLIFSLLCGIAAFVAFVVCIDDEEYREAFSKWRIRFAILAFIGFLGLTAIPSTKLAAAMYVVPAVANNEDVKAIGGNSLEALRKLTEKWLLEINNSQKQTL